MSIKKKCAFVVDDRIFNRDAILKTAYLYTDDCYLYLSYEKDPFVRITVEAKPGKDISDIDKRFCNELLSQMLRYRLSLQNKNIRELVLGRALYSTCIDTVDIDTKENCGSDDGKYSLDDIAVNWFEVYEDDKTPQV